MIGFRNAVVVPSPTKTNSTDFLPRDSICSSSSNNAYCKQPTQPTSIPRKSPKKRPFKRHAVVSSSSSTESLASDSRARYGLNFKGRSVKQPASTEEKVFGRNSTVLAFHLTY